MNAMDMYERDLRRVWTTPQPPGWENCKEASCATLLGLDLHDVRPFNAFTRWREFDPFETWKNMARWFAERDLTLVQLHRGFIPNCYYLAEGPTYPVPEGAQHLGHMVVMRSGNLAHDPTPGGRGLWRVDAVYIVVPQCLSDLRPHGWHPSTVGGLQLPAAARSVPAPPDLPPLDTYADAFDPDPEEFDLLNFGDADFEGDDTFDTSPWLDDVLYTERVDTYDDVPF